MAIQFILGASGTGKTNYIYNKMINDSMDRNSKPIVFMLPEQSNMAAEQDMVTMHPAGGTMDISITSFTRLAFKVFEELNIQTNDILDDYGKSMVIMKILKENEKKLSYYKNMSKRNGFVAEIKSILSEFYQYQISEDKLERIITELSPDKSIYYKLQDLRIILQAFNEYMKDSYMVTEQIMSQLKEVIHESKLIKDADVYFDGFTGFTPIQYDVVEEIIKTCNNAYFVFTMNENVFGNNNYSNQGLFTLGKQSVDKICELAQKNQIQILPHIGMQNNFRLQKNTELHHLERNIFRYPNQIYSRDITNISILSAKDSRQEALYIAKTIKHYVMMENYSYKDFAIITGDLKEQAALWKQIMDLLQIPYFLDYSETLSHNPIVDLVGMLLDLFRTDFSYESVFSLLKTGFFDIEMERIYDLENYALQYGVRGYNWWNKAFRGGKKGLHEINETRKQFMDAIANIANVFKNKNAKAKEYLVALYEFIVANKMAEKLHEQSLYFETQGDLRASKAYIQAYDKFITVLDKTMDILGEDEIEREHFAEILLTGVADVQLGLIPSTLDQVIIGDMERTRLHHVKILFVAGANDGLIPKTESQYGILADKERRLLREMNFSLAPDSKEEMYLQQFYLYLQMAQAQQRLVFTYRQVDAKGAESRPAYFLNRVQQIFPALKVKSTDIETEGTLPVTLEELIAQFAEQLSKESLQDSSFYKILQQQSIDRLEQIIQGYMYNNEAGILDKSIAKKLYGEYMQNSVSKLETYTQCAYHYFLQYGLGITKRKEYKIESNHIGTILHTVMEKFFKKVKSGEIQLSTITQTQLDDEAKRLTYQAAIEENETIFESSCRNRHQLNVLTRVAKRSIENLCRHLKQGNMELQYFEKQFSSDDKLDYIDIALSDGVKMELKGIVDRVDIKEEGDTVYVKIIDYKSGAKDIDYTKMYEGKQLQLAVYMSVMLELLEKQYPNKKIIPTGMYYYHVSDPIVEEFDEEKVESKRINNSRLTGLVNETEESLNLMDGKTGLVTPVRYKKDGDLDSRNDSLVSTDELNQISRFVKNKLIEIGENIISGEIPMNPEKGDINSPCNFCDYKHICRFEPGIGGNEYRISSQLDKQEAKERILE